MFLEAGFEILARFGGEQGRFWQILKHVSSYLPSVNIVLLISVHKVYFCFISEPDKESEEELDEGPLEADEVVDE